MTKRKIAIIAIVVPAFLTVAKAIAGFATMSISILASALDSLMDVFSSLITMVAVSTAEKPADEKHPFGHGKAEAIAGLIQAILIAISGSFLIYHAFRRIVTGYQLEAEWAGISVMIVAMIVSIFLAYGLKRVGRRTKSSALAASSLNFGADVWTNGGVLVALGLENWGGVKNADPIISILISLYIIVSAIKIAADAITQLMDKTLPNETLAIVDECIHSRGPQIKGYHKLRSRSVGGEKFIEFHLEIESSLSFEAAHDLTERIIADIEKQVPGSKVTAHSDPK
ncbi:MAG: cation transporter [Deltaproteobacteria bacterium]|jgi:ferrous-iron efflux pump FieF|nr:cation transporter [Deltaproteobacteria bacterium]